MAPIHSGMLLTGMLMIASLTCCAQKPQKSKNKDFIKTTLSTDFLSEGVSVTDVNKDGRKDILAGYHWFEAPNWTKHEIAPSRVFDPKKEYSNSFLNLTIDVNQDGWTDQVVIDFPGQASYWFENPQNKPGPWRKYTIANGVGLANESPAFVDIDDDGRLDILCGDPATKQIIWLQAPTRKGDTTWTRHEISERNTPGSEPFSHGIGYGDINHDGRKDVVIREGWFERPEDISNVWKFHPANLGEPCSHMQVFDVNGDGLHDVVSASAHALGIWWYEQFKTDDGRIDFKRHLISEVTAQTHSSIMADIDGDGKNDYITGKRFLAHHGRDPGDSAAALLYWFEPTPGKEPYFIPHEVDNDSGAGLNIVAEDMNNDGTIDLVISNKKGVFLLENKIKRKKRKNN